MTAPDTDTLAGLLAECTPGPWKVFIDDTGGQWSGWPLSINAPSITDKTVVRPGGQWPYEWDAKTSQHEAVTNAHLIALAPELAAAVIALRAQAAKDKARIERLEAALLEIADCGQSAEPDHWKFRCMARGKARAALEDRE